MNPFVFTCIAPHGMELIPEMIGEIPARMEKTRNSMSILGEEMKAANPDVIIVLTPHGTRINGQFSIVDSERMVGIAEERGYEYKMEKLVDRDLAKVLEKAAKEKQLPVGSLNFATASGPFSCMQLDWGAIVPLRYMPDVPIVVITPSRDVDFDSHLKLGEVIAKVASQSSKRIGLVASCDWSHTHDEKGPYGYHPSAKQLDEEVVELIKTNQLEKMSEFSPDYVSDAKPDGISQVMILAGAIPMEERKVEFLSYEAPTYFGLLCALYR